MKVKERIDKHGCRVFAVSCHPECDKLRVYAPRKGDRKDGLYEIGGVCAERKEWRRLFREAGL